MGADGILPGRKIESDIAPEHHPGAVPIGELLRLGIEVPRVAGQNDCESGVRKFEDVVAEIIAQPPGAVVMAEDRHLRAEGIRLEGGEGANRRAAIDFFAQEHEGKERRVAGTPRPGCKASREEAISVESGQMEYP